jgi:ppGpp synthetase/RelA/SpoT-type nucleotidyltranferase
MSIEIDALQAEFKAQIEDATKLKSALIEQLDHLFSSNKVSLGVPIEGRVKTWSSIAEKIERKSLSLNKIGDLDDLVGIRTIFLFRPDLSVVDQLLKSTFNVESVEDTSSRLSDNQFGYQSQHYIVRIPEN